MLNASSSCESSGSWCPQTPPSRFDSTVIRGWLTDQLGSPCRPCLPRRRARSPSVPALQPKRRRPLQPTHANMKRRSPTRQARHEENDVSMDEGYVEDGVVEDSAITPKPTKRGRQHRSTQPSLDPAAFSSICPPENIASSSSYTTALTQRPLLQSCNIDSSASSAQSGKPRSRRATSPAKTYSDLQLLNKPVKYGVVDAERDDLPEDIRTLVKDVQALCENVGIIPLEIQDRIPGAKRRSHWTNETGRDDLDLMIELDAMKRVHTAAVSLSTTGDYEPQWYCSVQWPLLDMAFRHQSHIEPKQMYVPSHSRYQ